MEVLFIKVKNRALALQTQTGSQLWLTLSPVLPWPMKPILMQSLCMYCGTWPTICTSSPSGPLTRARSSGHPTSCSSAAEVMSVLFFYMRYKQADPENPDNDWFILSKRLSFFDVATRWLRQGGCMWDGIYCLVGDRESSEGSVWEALALASHYSLDDLEAIYNVNHLSHSGSLPLKKCCKDLWVEYLCGGQSVRWRCSARCSGKQLKWRISLLL